MCGPLESGPEIWKVALMLSMSRFTPPMRKVMKHPVARSMVSVTVCCRAAYIRQGELLEYTAEARHVLFEGLR